ncbi:TetR/AcrR family transcriptional regulator [Deinococcus pimensis]|uniref:TetR/AcrR family transcriptional regulator n=1 Tax=Deinococcus pimensis TaxID=309888 RepID=UPI00048601FB|nr:TetR family transcriptional regulator [Deinococcus pimensis]
MDETPEAPTPRRRGRPARGSGLTERVILDAALTHLETNRDAFTMRALARTLGTDVMAIYHHYPNKAALVAAAVRAAFAPLDDDHLLDDEQDVPARVETLAAHYLRVIRAYPGLTLDIAAGKVDAEHVVRRFDTLFAQAAAPLALDEPDARRAGHVLVDYLHGHILGSDVAHDDWRYGVRLLTLGLQQLRAPKGA